MDDRPASCCSQILNIDDHNDVFTACRELKAEWKEIGLALGIRTGSLETIYADEKKSIRCMLEMIGVWLKHDSDKQPYPTWRGLCLAIASVDRMAAERISKEHQCHCSHCTDTPHSQVDLSPVPLPSRELKLPNDHVDDHSSMSQYYHSLVEAKMGALTILLVDVNETLEDSNILLDSLKMFLSLHQELRNDVRSAKSLKDGMIVVGDYTSLINTKYLQAVAENFQLKVAIDLIKKFDDSIDKFCKTMPIKYLYGQNLMRQSRKRLQESEEVEFVLEWDSDETTLSDIPSLLIKAFRIEARHVIVKVVNEGNSIIVTCYAPPHLHKQLKILVKDNEAYLRKEKVLCVTIGGEIVLNRDMEDQLSLQEHMKDKPPFEKVSQDEKDLPKQSTTTPASIHLKEIGRPNYTEQSKTAPVSIPLKDIDANSIDTKKQDKTQQDFAEILEKAKSEGFVTVKWSKFATFGASGVGKTSLLNLLLKKPPVSEHHSTTAVTSPEVCIVSQTPDENSGNGDDSSSSDESLEHVDETVTEIEGNLYLADGSSFWIYADPELVKIKFVQALKKRANNMLVLHKFPQQHDVQIHNPQESYDDQVPTDKKPSETTAVKTNQKPSPTQSEVNKELLQLISEVDEPEEVYEDHWIHGVDSGGLAAFIDVAPALLRYHSLNLVLIRLDEKLDDLANFFSVHGQKVGKNEQRQMTTLQLTRSFFQYKSQPVLDGVVNMKQQGKPWFVVLGTHYDKYKKLQKNNQLQETLEEKNERLRIELKSYDDVRHNFREGQIIFPINTLKISDKQHDIAHQIRKFTAQSYITAEVPARWFFFQLELKSKAAGRNMIRLEECLEIGSSVGMQEDEVKAALLYFHNLTLFLYFPSILPDVIFHNPQALFDMLSRLIAISYEDCSYDGKHLYDAATISNLRENGIFERNVLDTLEFGEEVFSADHFLKLMQGLLIISELPNDRRYFIPCVLNVTDQPFEVFSDNDVEPLLFTWDNELIPNGLFTSLVVFLLRLQCQTQFQLGKGSYRNKIVLRCEVVEGIMHLVDHVKCLGIRYVGPRRYCPVIRQIVLDGIASIVKKFDWDVSLALVQEVFQCKIERCTNTTFHFCRLDVDQGILTCNKTGVSSDAALNRHLLWYYARGITATTISHIDLPHNILKPHIPHLLDVIANPDKLAKQLSSNGLISEKIKAEMLNEPSLSRFKKASRLLNEVQHVLELSSEPKMLKSFCYTLKEQDDPALNGVADTILNQLGISHKVIHSDDKNMLEYLEKKSSISGTSLHNMELIAEYHTKFSSDKPLSVDWDKYGCRLQIPESSIPQGEVGTLDLYAIYSGPFQFPEDSSPVSAYYVISLSHDLLKPAILELQHCYIINNDDDTAQLTFASATTSTGPPYHFRPVIGGSFLPGKYAVIHQTKFSIFGILVAHVRAIGQSISRWFNSVQYALSYFLIRVQYPKMWKVKLFITQYTNAHIELKQDQERSENLVDSEYFLFVLEEGVDTVSTLVVPEEDSITDLKARQEKWKTDKKVVMKKWEVRTAVTEVPVVSEPPPCIQFRIEWIDELPAERCVFHIHLFGIIQDIRIPVSVPFPIGESGSMSYPTETQLKSTDLPDILRATNEISDWFTLGIFLKVDYSKLKTLQKDYPSDHNHCRQEMLMFWISSGNATWSILVKTLRDDMKEPGLAERIEKGHLR